jgi:NAD(P)-dependent dehydrogenase (short-subunit alcohol dehydrogenase family)
VERTAGELGRLDVLVNHAGEQHVADRFEEITADQLERTFATNVFAMFHLTKAALAQLPEGGAIVNTTSVTAYEGNPSMIDYSPTNGAIVSFTRALAKQLCRARYPGQRRRARADLDAPDPGHLSAGQGGGVRKADADGTDRPARRAGARLRLSGLA